MIVVDASLVVAAPLNAGPVRSLLGIEQVHVPHPIDPEVGQVLRCLVAGGNIDPDAAGGALPIWRYLGVVRYPIVGLLECIRQLRNNLSANDAYLALAKALGCPLVT